MAKQTSNCKITRVDKKKEGNRQVNQYDKILQENLEAALPGIIKNVLQINAVYSEELPDSLQHTRERKPDVLKKVIDDKGNTFVLHIEFQVKNDADMAYRMAEYLVMLLRIYRLPVKQFVIYIGEGNAEMPTVLINENSYFSYQLITLSSIDYRLFLNSANTEEKIFAILGSFGNDEPKMAITRIFNEVIQNTPSELAKERRKNQLRILGQLRNFTVLNIDIMESVSTFFKEENDIFYIRGIKKEGELFVNYLLTHTDYSIEKIAQIAEVPVSFVERIKNSSNGK